MNADLPRKSETAESSSQRIYARSALLSHGWADDVEIEICGDTIISAKAGVTAIGEQLDVLIPGIPNLHSHGFQRLIAGLAESRNACSGSFWSWRDYMFRILAALDPDSLEDVYSYVFASMLEAGYTSVAEFHYVHNSPDGRPYDNDAEMSLRAVRAACAAGLPITHLPVVYCRGGFDGAPLGSHQRRLACDTDRALRLAAAVIDTFKGSESVNVGIAPHSLRAVPPSDLARVAEAAAQLGSASVLHIHVSEQIREVQDCVAAHGLTPIQLLLQSVDVNGRWNLVHCTQATAQELKEIARSGAIVGLCPITEANLGDGCIDLPALVASGSRFGVGSDSQASINPWREFQLLEYSQRFTLKQRNIACDSHRSVARFLFDHCTEGGARALGRQTGRLAPGYKADMIELRRDADPCLALLSGDQFLDAWTFAADRPRPTSVFAAGQLMVRNGVHVASRPLKEKYFTAVRKLHEKM